MTGSTSDPTRDDAARTLSARPLILAYVLVVGLHVLGWGPLLLGTLVLPASTMSGSGTASLLAVGLTAYALGLRHAFDADHIAAIDNTTRALQQRGRPSRTVGLWFSLGHSTVVFVLVALVALGLTLVARSVTDDSSLLHQVTGIWGPTVSSLFLLVIAAVGFLSLRPSSTARGGWVTRSLGGFQNAVDRPTRMYVVGFLFGLGFDTATEIGLLALAGTAAVTAIPWWVVLSLPLVFASGMSLLDTTQGALARQAYAYSPDGTTRNGYAVFMTVLSAVAAVVVAVVQLAGVAAENGAAAGPIGWLAGVDIEDLGVWLTVAILAAWLVAVVIVLARRRWSPPSRA